MDSLISSLRLCKSINMDNIITHVFEVLFIVYPRFFQCDLKILQLSSYKHYSSMFQP